MPEKDSLGPTAGPGTDEETRTRRRSAAETRQVILDAARERFAADGYERATIRAVARDARIDPSMVMRYFGSKEGLFAAASAFDLGLPDIPAGSRDVGEILVRHFLRVWENDGTFTVLLRAGVTQEQAAQRMQEILRDQLLPLATRLCPDPSQAPVRAALAASQLLGMALTRYVLRFPGSVALADDEILAWLAPTIERYMTAEEA